MDKILSFNFKVWYIKHSAKKKKEKKKEEEKKHACTRTHTVGGPRWRQKRMVQWKTL